MLKLIITKLFCHHTWGSHATRENTNKVMVITPKGTIDMVSASEKVSEVLICQSCGKIKNILY